MHYFHIGRKKSIKISYIKNSHNKQKGTKIIPYILWKYKIKLENNSNMSGEVGAEGIAQD